jgi:hypothetical protein
MDVMGTRPTLPRGSENKVLAYLMLSLTLYFQKASENSIHIQTRDNIDR